MDPSPVLANAVVRFTTFSYRLKLTPEQAQALSRNAGAARFAFNQGLAMLSAAYAQHKVNPAIKVPYSKFDLINTFNAWKLSPDAAEQGAEAPGLAWRHEVIAQVFEEGLADLAHAVKRFFDARKKGGQAKQTTPRLPTVQKAPAQQGFFSGAQPQKRYPGGTQRHSAAQAG